MSLEANYTILEREGGSTSLAPREERMSLVDLFLKIAEHTPVVGDGVNRIAINHFAGSTTPRPRPYSLWSAEPAGKPAGAEYVTDYTSWPGLTNKQYSARHLPPADPSYIASLPQEAPYMGQGTPVGPVTSLFSRPGRITTSIATSPVRASLSVLPGA